MRSKSRLFLCTFFILCILILLGFGLIFQSVVEGRGGSMSVDQEEKISDVSDNFPNKQYGLIGYICRLLKVFGIYSLILKYRK